MTSEQIRDEQPPRGTILVTDDEPGMRLALREVLQRIGWRVALASGGEEALEWLRREEHCDLLVTDFRMGGMDGLQLLRQAQALRPGLPVIMVTAYGTIEDAVEAMKQGASDYLLKPFSFDTVLQVVEQATRMGASGFQTAGERHERREGHEASEKTGSARGGVIAYNPRMRRLLELAGEVAEADSTVLLTGESGTGKEVLARFIHEHSGRRGPLVAVNCAALPEGLLESELFGHEKGAFTGAVLARKGRFEQAHEGTLLLDEISEMPLALQAKLLRVIQEKEVQRVGADRSTRLDVRIIATSNRDLEKAVAESQFRQDLFYRLNVITLNLPPLHERPEDIEPLAECFLARYHRKGRPEQRLGVEARQWLRSRAWPGNVRELENVLERACLLAREELIRVEDFHLGGEVPGQPAAPSVDPSGIEAGMTLEEMEKKLILETLDRTGGNRTRAADLLGVSVRTIRNKLNHYGLAGAEEASGSCVRRPRAEARV